MFFILSVLCASQFVADRVIEGAVTGEWGETPAIAEALAFMQDVDHTAYWDILETMSSENLKLETIEDVLELSKQYIDEELVVLLNFSLQIRYYSPRIELFRNALRSKEAPQLKCRNAKVEKIPDSCDSEFFEYEPVFGQGQTALVFYIDVTKNDWKEQWNLLQSRENDVRFVVRPVGFSDKPVRMRGYGVQMKPFKYSMEFNVKDQSKMVKSSSSDLPEKKMIMNIELNQTAKEIKKDKLPFQIASFIKNSTDPINTLRELLTNFPLFAREINTIKVTEKLQANCYRTGQFVDPGQSALFINGRKLEGTDLNFYNIYEALIEEYKVNQVLRNVFDLDDDSVHIFRKSGNTPKVPKHPIVDARSEMFVHWINDLDSDEKAAAKYPKSLVVFGGEIEHFPMIARNVANAIFLLDPSDPNDLETLGVINELAGDQFPAHLGYTIAPMKRSPLAKKIYYAYVHVCLKYGMKAAHKMLMKVNDMRTYDEKTRKRGPVKQQFWANAFGSIACDRKSPSFKTIQDLFKPKSDETRFLQRLRDHVNRVGLSAPAIVMNGKFVEDKHPEIYLRTLMDEEIGTVRDLLLKRKLNDATQDIHDVILSHCGANKRYNKLIQRTFKDFSETVDIESQTLQNQKNFVKWMSSINYQHGTSSGVKKQTFWIFASADVTRETGRYMNDLTNADETRLAFFNISEELPPVVSHLVGYRADKVTVVFNGRIVRFDVEKFSRFDLQLLLDWEQTFSVDWAKNYLDRSAKKRSLGVSKSIRELSDSLLYMQMIASHLSHQQKPRTGSPYKTFKNRAVNLLRSSQTSKNLNIHLMLDPLSTDGQRLSCLLPVLRSYTFGLMLNPSYSLAKADLDILGSFYSLADDTFSFAYLNESTTYSLIPDVPLTWKIQREHAMFDMDNVVVDELQPGVHRVEFRLKSILLEGCATDANGRTVPGLELQLMTTANTKLDETRSINSNGYWQLSGNPGAYTVTTNSDQIFGAKIDSYFPKFRFTECQEAIEAPYNVTSIEDGKIHIFVVASGFLYERLERIMMLSAVKNTKTRVKFWILDNFVSPQHRNSLPSLAKKYNFEYSFTSYLWPRWMSQESARQRLFWGYKILFLDVMFPNNLKRVIYVDSDDVIRSDFMELMKMDIGGAPYAFTPFCDDKPEMEEYRFWNDGYWRNVLNGRKYHISAMFLVDLVQLRRQETGDLIRKAYEDLHNDGVSLANLDQDIPNILQTKGAKIFSLPQEWLWCGSWCSDATMSTAKTIDLCNNPKTKEGKLEYAKQHIAEWTSLDEEANAPCISTSDEL